MNILGLNTMENASACLIMDGAIIAAAEEERFTREKHQEGVPVNAARYCLKEGGIDLADIDTVALNWQPWRLGRRVLHVLKLAAASPRLFYAKAKRGAKQVAGSNEWWRMLSLPWNFHRLMAMDGLDKKHRCRFRFIDHHRSHAASAFYPSPFSRAAVLTLDGAGESACITFNNGGPDGIRHLRSIRLPHSLGHLYSATTAFLGFRPCSGEGKIMGLAPYGEGHYSEIFNRMVKLRDKGRLSIDFKSLDYHLALSSIFPARTRRIFGEPREKESTLEKRHRDIAASLQGVLERAALHMAEHLQRETGQECLCLAGGVALNACMNQHIQDNTGFERVFIQPAANDSGTALGAALAAYFGEGNGKKNRQTMTHAYLGPGFGEKEIVGAMEEKKVKGEYRRDIAEAAAKLVADGKIVGWFQGRMEFGPRALGNRSILADPRRPEMKDFLNRRVKHREEFRPFAPAVLEDRAGDYFESYADAAFMTKVARVLPDARFLIPAVVHVDGTARLQTVSRETNPGFYGLIEHFGGITGIPVVLNTSFNIRGEPIVCTPLDAINCYLGTGMDALAMGNFLLMKK